MSLVPVSKKIPAGITGILFGVFGIHKFIMGFPRAGMTMAAITVVCWILSHIWFLGFFHWGVMAMATLGFIEGVIYLAKSNTDFYRDYVINRRDWL